MSLRWLGVLLLLLLPGFSAVSGNWFAKAWQTDDGLPDNIVTGLAQTSDGFLWVGTAGGLVRFDGAQFQNFSPDAIPGTPNRIVRTMILDQQERFWLAMDRATLACVASNQVQMFTATNGLQDAFILAMVEDGKGAIWMAYFGSPSIVRIYNGEVTCHQEGLPRSGAISLAVDRNGQVWFVRGHYIGVFAQEQFRVLVRCDESAKIASARIGGVWVTTNSRLLHCDTDGKLEVKGIFPQRLSEVGSAFEDSNGAVWIPAPEANGLYRFSQNTFEAVATSHPLVTCMMEDREKNLWVGTSGGGLNRLRPRILEVVDVGDGPGFESAQSVAVSGAGDIWVVMRDGALMRQEGNTWRNMSGVTNWPKMASCVTVDHAGAVWLGTRGSGLYRYKNNQLTNWRKEEGLENSSIRSILAARNGDVWISLSTPGFLQRLRGGKFTTFNFSSGARSVRAMSEDPAGNIWAATAGGQLIRITGNELFIETTNLTSMPISIRCLHATSDGSLWIGYADAGGLGWLKDGKYARLTMAHGLVDDYVSQVISDKEGWLWLAGSRGFSRVPQEKLMAVIEGEASRVRPIIFGQGEGHASLQVHYDTYPAAVCAPDGRLALATRTGLAVLDPKRIHNQVEPPLVWIDRVTVDNEVAGLRQRHFPLRKAVTNLVVELSQGGPGLKLSPSHRKIEFEFTSPSLTAPENVLFRYYLEGLDEGWSRAGSERRASYSRLGAGNYQFRVIACNHSGVWNEVGARIRFTVQPFLWQTWWFRLAAVIVFTFAVIAIVRYVSFRRLRQRLQLAEQQAALDKERTRIARDLHDDLGGSLTQVALLLDMQSGKTPPPEETGKHTRLCADKVRQVVRSVDEIIWAINPRNDTVRYLVDYLSQHTVEFLHAANLRCRVELPDELPDTHISPEARHNLFLGVKEALNNIARHAHASEVWLRVMVEQWRLEVVLEDNGCGFVCVPDDSRADGLRNMRQRMEEVGGRFALDSKPGAGTRVTFSYLLPADDR